MIDKILAKKFGPEILGAILGLVGEIVVYAIHGHW